MKRFFLFLITAMISTQAWAKVQEIKTPGGFTVWLVEEHSLPIITTSFTFKESGIAYDPKGKEGRANMAAALMMEGAGERNAKAFTEALEDHAIRLNFSTDDDVFRVGLETLSEHKDVAFALVSDALLHARFDDDAMTRVKAQTVALIKEQSESPGYKLANAWQKAVYGEHPYGKPSLGDEKSVNGLSKADLTFFTHHYLSKKNIIISMVGDISPDVAAASIDRTLGGLPDAFAPDVTLTENVFPDNKGAVTVIHTIPQTMVAFGLPGIKRTDADYIAAYVMNHMLGGNGLTSILSKEIREKRGFAYSVGTQLVPKGYAATWQGSFSTRNAEVNNAVAELKNTLENFSKNGVSEAELKDAKAYLTGSFVLNLDSNDGIANFLTTMQLYGLGSDYLEKRNALINAVTMDDIKRVSKRIIAPDQLRIVMVGNPGK